MPVSAERITAAEVARLAVLGISVTDHKDYDLPSPDFLLRTDVYLYTSFGAAGVVYPTNAAQIDQDWHVHAIDMRLLEPLMIDIFGKPGTDELGYYWTMADYLTVFEGLAAWLTARDVARGLTGDIWALHCMLKRTMVPHVPDLATTAAAVTWLSEHGIAPTLFYKLLYRERGTDPLAGALAELQFVAAHPGVHPSLIMELFA